MTNIGSQGGDIDAGVGTNTANDHGESSPPQAGGDPLAFISIIIETAVDGRGGRLRHGFGLEETDASLNRACNIR